MKAEKAESNFIKAAFVEKNKIIELQISNKDSIKFHTFDGKDGKPDVQKIQCEITYKGQTDDSPSEWSLNNKCRNAIIDAWGEETDNWVNKPIPITLAGEGEMRHILVDSLRIA